MTNLVTVTDFDALLVVDIQNDFCAGGALAVPAADEIVPVVNSLAKKFAHIILTQDWHPPGHISFASTHSGRKPFEVIPVSYGSQTLWPDHCVQQTAGADFHKDLFLPHAELVLRKGYHRVIDSYSVFRENDRSTPTGLSGYLRERGLSRIFLAGLAYDFCVRYSAEDASHAGFETIVIEDCCRAIDLQGSAGATRQTLQSLAVCSLTSDQIG